MISRVSLAAVAFLAGAVFSGSPLAAETAPAARPTLPPAGRVFTNDDLSTYSPRVTPSPSPTSTLPAAEGPTPFPTDSSGRRIRMYGAVPLRAAPGAEAARLSGMKGGRSSREGGEAPKQGPAPASATAGAGASSARSAVVESGRGGQDEEVEDIDAKRQQWRQRADTTWQAVDAARAAAARCQAELDEIDRQITMGTSLTPWQLPEQRTRAEANLDSAQKALAEAEKAAEYLETDARQSSVPPGWVREREP